MMKEVNTLMMVLTSLFAKYRDKERRFEMIHKKKFLSGLVALAAVFFIALPVSAHVTVNPSQSTTEAWETYQVRIPVEKDVDTTKVTIKIPENVEYKMYEPVAGWKTTTTTDDNDKVVTITWEAESEETAIKAGQYREFTFRAQNPKEAGDIAWDAFQYYADGSIVEWTGDSDSELPHSITSIAKSNVSVDSHGHSHGTDEATDDDTTDDHHATDEDTEHSHEGTNVNTILLIIAIVLSVVAIVLTFIRKK